MIDCQECSVNYAVLEELVMFRLKRMRLGSSYQVYRDNCFPFRIVGDAGVIYQNVHVFESFNGPFERI